MNTFAVVVIYLLLFTAAITGCTFSQFSTKPENRPIFIQKIGRQSLILPVHGSQLEIEDASSVEVYCPGGFREEALRNSWEDIKGKDTVKLSCIGEQTVRSVDGKTYQLSEDESLNCTRPPIAIYENQHMHRFCEGTSYVVGMVYKNDPITLAEICYDMPRMKVKFQTYKAAVRTPVIAREQVEYEPISLFYPHNQVLVDAPSEQFYKRFLMMQNRTQSRFINKNVEYLYEDLIPGDAFEPYYANPMHSAKALSKIFWWKGLKRGNWRLFEQTLKRRSVQVSYDMILGTMGTSPDCNLRQGPLTEMDLSCTATPKLIWAFLSNEKINEHIVVIGVNTPYFELLSRQDTMMCRDVCDLITWLGPLNKFRKISALGYMYCCNAEHVRDKLEGVADLFFKKQYAYEVETARNSPTEDVDNNEKNSSDSEENEIDTEVDNESTTRKWSLF